ncbi:MAG: hypothetical protein KDD56_10645, partial [Bdellovibrionales bacterium]|nr:hypothetical protein [Bdellovibrionales bacterium]
MKSNASYTVILIVVFFIAFAIPLTFAAKVGGYFSSDSEVAEDKIFPTSVGIFSPDKSIEVINSSELNPQKDSDFLLSIWIQIKRLPHDGERVIFLSKYDGDSVNKEGYAMGFLRNGDQIRPQVYWKGKETKSGGWNTFSSVQLLPGHWYRFLLSYYDSSYLGLHAYPYSTNPEDKPMLLGGFDVGQVGEVESISNLSLGSVGSKNFRGRIGTVSIFSLKKLKNSFESVWRLLKDDDAYSAWDKDRIALWLENAVDKGRSRFDVKVYGAKD